MNCPICSCSSLSPLLNLTCGNLDGSSLYDPVVIVSCRHCGHVFNELSKADKQGTIDYYNNEYSFNNLDSPNLKGDLPGSSNENSHNRYRGLHQFVEGHITSVSRILDIGCATGGFLGSLYDKGYTKLHGIDLSIPYIEIAKQKKLDIKLGSAEEIPYEDNYFDFIVADQVVEHLFDLDQIFIEAKRVLKKDGLFCICVPDAMLYDEYYFFDFYWFLMREHVQHFDLPHLVTIANKYGFRIVKHATTFTNMNSEKVILPNLSVLFKFSDSKLHCHSLLDRNFSLRYKTKEYIEHSYRELENKMEIIDRIMRTGVPLYVFGASRELYYLYNNTNLKYCNIAGVIDDTEYKQQHFTFDGNKIRGRASLINSKDFVLITATAHTEKIREVLYDVGFKGRIIEI